MVLKGQGEVGKDGKNNLPVPSSGRLAPDHQLGTYSMSARCTMRAGGWMGIFDAKSKLWAKDHLCSTAGYMIGHRTGTTLLNSEH